jgi:multidrug efflux pump
MSLSSPFIRRPVGTTLLSIAIALAGAVAYNFLPVSPLPQVDYPSIQVSAALPGASPETMASSVATPLERQFSRIASVTEMTSSSSLGSTNITILFDLNRNIDAAARDVQAAINAASGYLPTNLPALPSYKKVNPADAPVMILSMTSDTYSRGQMYDAASSILSQKIAQFQGVGQVFVGGGALPAVRVEVNPTALNSMGLGLEDVRNVLANANANIPKGQIGTGGRSFVLADSDQLFKAKEYRPLIVAYRNGSPVRLSDIAEVDDSIEDIRTGGISDGKDAVLLVIFRQPNANIIQTVDTIRHAMEQLQAEVPTGMRLGIALDRTTTIRASITDVEFTLMLSIGLVILVVFLFLRNVRATFIPSVAVPISLIGTFGVMYLIGYSIDNLSLMSLTIATGFVVDDAIVVIENISRHLEEGLSPLEAALKGAAEIGFTVLSISISLIAVFIPILLMGGYVGRLFREFAVTLSVAIGISMVVSLTTTPMMCATLLKSHGKEVHGRPYRISESFFDFIIGGYEQMLRSVLRHQFIVLLVTLGTIAFTIYLFIMVPKGFFPQQDTGRLTGTVQADQDISAQAMVKLLRQYAIAVGEDPAVSGVIGFTGGGRGTINSAQMFVTLKDLSIRKMTADQVVGRLRPRLAHIPGGTLFLVPVQDVRIGGRQSASQYQYTLQGDNLADLNKWAPQVMGKVKTIPGVVDVNSDQQVKGLDETLVIDRQTAGRLGISAQQIDNVLYDAFGQRQVSTTYTELNQYHVVMEAAPAYWQNPEGLRSIYLQASGGAQIPLSTVTHFAPTNTALAVNHSGQFPSITISFNLLPGVSLGDAVVQIQEAARQMGLPESIHGNFSGTAQAFQDQQSTEILLVIFALVAVYIVLGILYESFVHPITILSTIPSAGVGALLALLIFHTDLTVIALIGIVLLIGIVKKNAIMMIDFALEAERGQGKSPEEAIFQACVLRFRPITMTTMAALLGGLPLAIGGGVGAEMRQPLGIAIVGGLIASQCLTLFTTPVIYLYLDRFRLWSKRLFGSPVRKGRNTDPFALPA